MEIKKKKKLFASELRQSRDSHSLNGDRSLRKGVLELCSKFAGENPCRSGISINLLQNNVIEITPRHRCSPVNLLRIYRTPSTKNTSGWLFLSLEGQKQKKRRKTLEILRLCIHFPKIYRSVIRKTTIDLLFF